MAKQKYYVVWEGLKTGVFTSWNTCKAQVTNYERAKYKSFTTLAEAEKAFKGNYKDYIGKTSSNTASKITSKTPPIPQSICVDGACDNMKKIGEYQGVYTQDSRPLFHQGPFKDVTNNIMEFLALVHALAYCKKNELNLPIYSDSKIAIGWVQKKTLKTTIDKATMHPDTLEIITKAEHWLHTNTYPNKILKWQTKEWGENLADFGRK